MHKVDGDHIADIQKYTRNHSPNNITNEILQKMQGVKFKKLLTRKVEDERNL